MLTTKTLYFQSPLRLYTFTSVWLSTLFFFRGLLMGPSYSHLWSIDQYWLSVLTCLKAGFMLSSFPWDQMNWEVHMPENVLAWFPLFPCLTSFFPLPAFPGGAFFINPFHPNPSPSVCSWSSPSEMVLQQIWKATHRVSSCHICFTH